MREELLAIEKFILTEFGAGETNSPLLEPLKYVMLSGGKRIRPLFLVAIASDCGVGIEKVVRVATALEAIHTASLIHDDLPALDNDDLRRGIPSCHKRFGEATAILTADFLFGHAFSLINSATELSLETRSIMIGYLSNALKKLCEGQELDLHDKSDNNTVLYKTAALFAASAAFAGAICFAKDEEKIRSLEKFGEKVGILFQLIDDIQDGELKNGTAPLEKQILELYQQKRQTESDIGFALRKTETVIQMIIDGKNATDGQIRPSNIY